MNSVVYSVKQYTKHSVLENHMGELLDTVLYQQGQHIHLDCGIINQEIKMLCKQDAAIIITPHSPLQTMMDTVI